MNKAANTEYISHFEKYVVFFIFLFLEYHIFGTIKNNIKKLHSSNKHDIKHQINDISVQQPPI